MITSVKPTNQSTALNAIVCLDGSARSAEALRPALALSRARDENISVVVLDGGRAGVRQQVEQQLAAVGLPTLEPEWAASKDELVAHLQAHAEAGGTPVLATFGRWGTLGRLFGVLGDLIRAGAPRVLTVGPNTISLAHGATGPIVVSSDNVCRADRLIEATHSCINDRTSKIVVAHVVPPSEVGMSYVTSRDASKFRAEFGVPVEAVSLPGTSVSKTISDFARAERASLIIAYSWHRAIPNRPASASNSLSIVAKAPAPVVIVN